jgi:hypothetical protein
MSAMTSGDTHGGLFGGLSKAVLNTRKLINSVKSLWSMVGNQWVTGESVQVGYYRFYNGKRYRCIQAHTTSTSILPTNTTYWTEQTVNQDLYSLNTNYANNFKLLWTNPNPTSSFTAQTIRINLNNFKAVLIESKAFKDHSNTLVQSFVGMKGVTLDIYCGGANGAGTSGTVMTSNRNATISATGVSFSSGWYHIVSGSAQDDRHCIPYHIYGIN